MGVSTDGILFYGVWFGPEDDDLPDWLDSESYDIYEEWERRISRSEADLIFGSHGSDSYHMWYVGVSGCGAHARRGYPEDVTAIADEALGVGREYDDKLREFLRQNDLPEREIKLWLSSYWG